MRVTSISYTRVLSDRCYGNHQATVHGELAEGEDPAAALAEARRLACEAVGSPLIPMSQDSSEPYEDEEPEDEGDDYLPDPSEWTGL